MKIASVLYIFDKSLAWYSFLVEYILHFSENAKKYLADHPEIFDAIDHQVRVQYGLIEDEEGTTPTTVSEDLAPNQEVTLDLGDGLEIEIED